MRDGGRRGRAGTGRPRERAPRPHPGGTAATDPIADEPSTLDTRLTRRAALRTYAPPALAIVAVANVQTFGTSGRVKVEDPKVEEPKGGGKK